MKIIKEYEADIQRNILDYLKFKNIFHFRASIGGLPFQKKDGSIAIKKNRMTGCPDILGVIPNSDGKMFAIEIKTKTGKLSPAQKEWMEKLLHQNVKYCLARSLDDVIAFIRDWPPPLAPKNKII